jgi:hypothetical protein
MAYTPELSQLGSATLRRLAWFRGKPMSKTLEVLLEATGRTMAEIRPGEICSKCKEDSICERCPFKIPPKWPGPNLWVRLICRLGRVLHFCCYCLP